MQGQSIVYIYRMGGDTPLVLSSRNFAGNAFPIKISPLTAATSFLTVEDTKQEKQTYTSGKRKNNSKIKVIKSCCRSD
ncbi:MAG: hypothetical protein HC785_17390 [Calothrix sp. CSU_2_0]|nr:hypothetical protein [Calothrix sp. CSU_2_0]